MCGIFGVIAGAKSNIKPDLLNRVVNRLFVLSEARGKESSGIAVKNVAKNKIFVLKQSKAASALIKSQEYKNFYDEAFECLFSHNGQQLSPFAMLAHARLVTNGTQENNNNNQPTVKEELVAVHNGIITNVDELWDQYPKLERNYEVDTEVFLAIVNSVYRNGKSLEESVAYAYSQIKGTASVGILKADASKVCVATNNGSVYYSISSDTNLILFASEEYILKTLIVEMNLKDLLKLSDVKWMSSGNGLAFDLETDEFTSFRLKAVDAEFENLTGCSAPIEDKIINYSKDTPIDIEAVRLLNQKKHNLDHIEQLLEFHESAIKRLRRCSKCVLPETFPFIKFDENGICNYCNKYVVKRQGAREEEFKELMKGYRSQDGKPDCIIPFSGGRDSSYGLHYIVHELGLKPITYTYDWGMVTDLARRNIARVCGKLGIENIIVSADLPMKRRNIRLNVEAWLKNPKLGMIPLFMAGDKQFFHYVNQIKKQTGIKLDIWSTNILENTDFKVGFCGISPSFDKTRPDYLPLMSKVSLAGYYISNFISNPSYLNASIPDTISSFYSYYAEPRTHFYQLFDWVKWDEKKIENTLFNEYEWELSPDTVTSWRIGDGTAAFYNYIYYTVAGFSEFDTFRSNQIREGLITREEALDKIYLENKPRLQSMYWYFDTIQVDIENAIKIVNNIPKLYSI